MDWIVGITQRWVWIARLSLVSESHWANSFTTIPEAFSEVSSSVLRGCSPGSPRTFAGMICHTSAAAQGGSQSLLDSTSELDNVSHADETRFIQMSRAMTTLAIGALTLLLFSIIGAGQQVPPVPPVPGAGGAPQG